MTAYIERIVTEVMVQPENSETGESTDQRWLEAQKITSVMKNHQQQLDRINAEGLDD